MSDIIKRLQRTFEATGLDSVQQAAAEIVRLRGVIKERETLLFDWLENGDAAGPDSPMEKTLLLFQKIGDKQ